MQLVRDVLRQEAVLVVSLAAMVCNCIITGNYAPGLEAAAGLCYNKSTLYTACIG